MPKSNYLTSSSFNSLIKINPRQGRGRGAARTAKLDTCACGARFMGAGCVHAFYGVWVFGCTRVLHEHEPHEVKLSALHEHELS